MSKQKSISSRIFEIIIGSIIGLIIGFSIVFIYNHYMLPDIMYDFKTYDGICFDYKKEEENYINNLYYKQLTEDQARHYRCMYHASINDDTKYYLESFDMFDSDDAARAVLAFSFDYPEYYWFGQIINANTVSEKDYLNLFSHYYVEVSCECDSFKEDDLFNNKNIINRKVEEIIPTLIGENDVDTIKNVYDYVVNNVEYNLEYINMSDIRPVFLFEKGVCSSYAEAFQLLCNKLGYECYSVQGNAEYLYETEESLNNEVLKQIPDDALHEWNIIKINDSWYWVDTTWGDNDNNHTNLQGIVSDVSSYSFFLVPDSIFLLDHTPDVLFKYPECNDDSLYFNEGSVLIDNYDESLINYHIGEAFKNKRNDFTFHFTSGSDVDKFLDWIEQGKFYNVYQNTIYLYYSGNLEYNIATNCSVYLNWRIKNLY